MLERVRKLLRDEEGPTAAEYAIMIGALAVVVIAAVVLIGHKVSNTFDNAANKIGNGP